LENKRGTDTVCSPNVEDMGEEFSLGTKSVPPEKEEKKYYYRLYRYKIKIKLTLY
tara:strand:+ start:340 stop:504 length:165 start_codon:yes stop_codon:yes gene_type:complete